MLRGLVACPTRKILQNRCSEVESEDILVNIHPLYLAIQRVLIYQINVYEQYNYEESHASLTIKLYSYVAMQLWHGE